MAPVFHVGYSWREGAISLVGGLAELGARSWVLADVEGSQRLDYGRGSALDSFLG